MFRIGACVNGDDEIALAAHQLVQAKILEVSAVAEVDETPLFGRQTKDFAEAREWLTSFARVVLATDAALEPNADYYIRVRMRTSPRRTVPLWPWGTDDGTGRADFTFIR